jgi:NOL1/NOP2/fmu family ribosome biogenesis protein
MKFLNAKERKKILQMLKAQYGFGGELDYEFLMNEKNKIFIVTKDIKKINIEDIRINTIGLYIGELHGDEIRLSIEGSQMIGPQAKNNIIEISDKDAVNWMKGQELHSDYPSTKFVIIKHNDDFLGCGKIKEKRVLNYIPKTRRISL